jgi:hypothetical protein
MGKDLSTKLKNLLVVSASLLALSLIGCVEYNTVYRDLPVEFEEEEQNQTTDELSITMGLYEEQLFRPLDESSEVPVIQGFQGGTWVHLSIRVTGLPPDGMIRASLGEVGQIRYGIRLSRSPEGFLEAYDIPVPVPLTEADLERFYGQEVTLKAEFSANGEAVSSELKIIVVEG